MRILRLIVVSLLLAPALLLGPALALGAADVTDLPAGGRRRTPPLLPAGRVGPAATAQGFGLLLLRLGPAAVFLAHGYLKLFGGPHERTVALFLPLDIPY